MGRGARPKTERPLHNLLNIWRRGFVEVGPARAFRDGPGILVSKEGPRRAIVCKRVGEYIAAVCSDDNSIPIEEDLP
jgi:hypothetical protein